MIIAAEPGYSLVMLRRPTIEGQDPWSLELVVRFPVLAWEYLGEGYLRPCMPFPLTAPDYIIETPAKGIIGFNQATGGSVFADDLPTWLEMGSAAVRASDFARQPAQGSA